VESITSQLLALCEPADLADLFEVGGPYDVTPAARPTVAAALREAAPGSVSAAQHRGQLVAVAVLADGRAFAVPDRCPHDGGLLSDGFVEGDRIVCARHGWEIDPCTGQCPQRPRTVIDARELRRR
jgi:nitrite reductase/ring-hydroxylating ferredoxin subunit